MKGSSRGGYRQKARWRGGLYGDEPMPTNFRVKSAGSLLEQALQGFDMNAGIDEKRLGEAWASIVGAENSKFTKPLSVKAGVIRIAILQPSMKFHYQQIQRQLLKTLQRELPDEDIKSIRFVVA